MQDGSSEQTGSNETFQKDFLFVLCYLFVDNYSYKDTKPVVCKNCKNDL